MPGAIPRQGAGAGAPRRGARGGRGAPGGRRVISPALVRGPGAGERRREARRCRDARAARRMLALALVLEGSSREEAARAAGMDRQTLRDWVHRYNAEGLAGLRDRPRSGRRPRLTPEQEAELAAAVARGPDPDRGGGARWRRGALRALFEARFAVRLHDGTVGKALPRPGVPAGRGAAGRAGHLAAQEGARVRGPIGRARARQAAARARLRPPVGASRAPEGGRGGGGGVQKGFAELVREALPERAGGKPV